MKMKDFYSSLDLLVGKECWGFVAGQGTGSILALNFGKKILREKPVDNPHLSEDCRNFDPEFSFLIYSPWRLNNSTEILSASYYDNSNDGAMINGLNKVLNKSVESISCESPCNDLSIEFEDNTVLKIFACDIGFDEDSSFYNFYSPSGIFSVVDDSRIEFEPSSK